MGPTEALARFAVEMDGRSLSAPVVHAGKRAILDCIGVALAGSLEPAARIVTAQVLSHGGAAESVIWGAGGERTSAQNAALANGTAAHVLDYDDYILAMPGHPSVPVLPAALAVGERLHASGAAVLASFLVGFEVETKLGAFSGGQAYDVGWHPTSTLGVIGATAAVGRLLGLDLSEMRHALGIAVSMAAGVRQNFGSMTKPFHVGRAAQSAILAAELAQRGFTSSQEAIEGQFGFWDVFAGALNRDGDALARTLGNPFAVAKPGVSYKAWPCCASTFGGVDAALQVTAGLSDAAIESVTVDVPYTAPLILIHHRPTTPLAARFSLEYCVAAALLDGRVTLSHFTQEAVRRPDLQSLLRRIDYRVPEDWEKGAGTWKQGHGRVEVRLRDGSVRRGATTAPRGDAANPMSDEDLEAKFLECASLTLGEGRAKDALELIRSVERLDDVGRLTDMLTGAAAAR
ncbi:MAG TPA: MmgE/PrpD family protein [Candidatus Methylomirabilis sp.]|nr:MmgE/PrpD family protein [Candidatus Methylomirabilis sp.]